MLVVVPTSFGGSRDSTAPTDARPVQLFAIVLGNACLADARTFGQP